MLQVSSTQIHQWADTRFSQSKLPDLIRRLILTTIDYRAIDHIAFPCGDDIGRPGYDGVLTTRESNPYIPIGKSVWEMSTQKGIDAKANSDYLKRTSVVADHETTDVRKASNRGLKVKVSTFQKWSYSFLRKHGVFNEYSQMERSEHNEILSHSIAETRKSFQGARLQLTVGNI